MSFHGVQQQQNVFFSLIAVRAEAVYKLQM